MGAVGVAVYPWEVVLEPAGTVAHGSAMNRIEASVVSVTDVGNRARVGLLAGQPLVAEVTSESVARLGLGPGVRGRRDLEGDRDAAGLALGLRSSPAASDAARAAAAAAARCSWTKRTTVAPSPTAVAQRLIEPERTSPAA